MQTTQQRGRTFKGDKPHCRIRCTSTSRLYLITGPVTGQRQIPPLNLSRVGTASLPSVALHSSNSSLLRFTLALRERDRGVRFSPSHTPAPTHFSHCDGSLAALNCDDEAWLRSISSICPRPILAVRQDFYACVGGNKTPDWPPSSQICGSASSPKPQSLTLSTTFLLIARRSTNHLWQW